MLPEHISYTHNIKSYTYIHVHTHIHTHKHTLFYTHIVTYKTNVLVMCVIQSDHISKKRFVAITSTLDW